VTRILIAAGVALGLFAPAVPMPAAHAYQAPLTFTADAGQTDERVRYLAQGAGYSFLFADDRAVLSLARGDQGLALELRFLGTSPDAHLEAAVQAAGKVINHLTSTSEVSLPTYEELTYRDLWPGIDLVLAARPARSSTRSTSGRAPTSATSASTTRVPTGSRWASTER
jgi:hypothetical protein